MRRTSLIVAATWVLLAAPSARPSEPEPAPTTTEELERRIVHVLEETGTPGAGVALVGRDGPIWVAGVGLADREAGTSATADTLFRIGSISKTFVGLAALMLVEEGRLDLDAPVRELAPEIEFHNPWADTDPVRFAHLLEHTTGWDDLSPADYAHNVTPPITIRQGLDFRPRSRTSRWRPGTAWSYCNSGPGVAAHVVGKLADRPFETFVRERLFDPLGMHTADYQPTDAVRARLATGYARGGPVEYWNIILRPSGAINASAGDMAGFVGLFVNEGQVGGRTLVRPESLQQMRTPSTTRAARAGLETGSGLSSFARALDGFVWHGHGGGMDGYVADFAYLPEHGVGYAVMINSDDGGALRRLTELARRHLSRDLEPPPPTSDVVLDEAVLQSYAGYYEPITPRQEVGRFLERLLGIVRVTAADDGLTMGSLFGPSRDWVAVSPHLFRREDRPVATAVFLEENGETILARAAGGESRRVPAALVWGQSLAAVASLVLMGSALLLAPVWLLLYVFGKRLRQAPYLGVLALPALSAACFFTTCLVIVLGFRDPIGSFGYPTVWSVSFFALNLLFAVTAVGSLVVVVLRWRAGLHAAVRVHALLVALACLVVTLYLGYWGILGWRTWV